VSQVFLSGNYLIEVGPADYTETGAAIRVALAATPNQQVAQWALTNLPVLGATFQSNLLYVVQGPPAPYYEGMLPIAPALPANGAPTALTMTVIDASQLPALTIAGQTNIPVTNSLDTGLQAVWPQPGILVWVGTLQQDWYSPIGVAQPLSSRGAKKSAAAAPAGKLIYSAPDAAGRSSSVALPALWFGVGGGIDMLAFDVSNDSAPAFLTNLVIAGGGWANGTAPFATNGLVYASHAQWNLSALPVDVNTPVVYSPPPNPIVIVSPAPIPPVINSLPPIPPVINPPPPIPVANPAAKPLRASPHRAGKMAQKSAAKPDVISIDSVWSESNCLDVVDFSIPASPVVRDPVSISGALAGISLGGNVIYALSMSNTLDALAYDGLNAWLVASLRFKNSWLPPALVSDENIFIAQPNAAGTNQLQTWTLTDAGAFSLLGSLAVPSSFDTLCGFGPLLVGQSGDAFFLYDASQPASLQPVGGAAPSACYWPAASGEDGALGSGLWVPLGDYGVLPIPAP
jgi:hypothetical protein